MNGKAKRMMQVLRSLREEKNDYTKALRWVDELKRAVELDPGLNYDLRIVTGELDQQLKKIAFCRALQLLTSLRNQTGKIPESYLRADIREIQGMIEKGILSYVELGIKHTELLRLAH